MILKIIKYNVCISGNISQHKMCTFLAKTVKEANQPNVHVQDNVIYHSDERAIYF